MPNPLLPPNLSFEDLRVCCARLPEQMPVVDMLPALDLRYRPEYIWVGARGCGKSELARQLRAAPTSPASIRTFDIYDDDGQDTDDQIIATMRKMLRSVASEKHYAPSYKPIILLRSSTWHRIATNFTHYIPAQRIAHLTFPPDAYATALLAASMPIEIVAGYLGAKWHQQFLDANGHFIPMVAWQATRYLAEPRPQYLMRNVAVAMAGLEHLKRYYAAYLPYLSFVLPDDAKYRLQGVRVSLTGKRIEQRLRTVSRLLPLGQAKTRWMRQLEADGIWRREKRGYFSLARLYGGALCTNKYSLTLESCSINQ